MTTATGYRRMTDKIEHRPAPGVVLAGGGAGDGLSVLALRLVEKAEAVGRGVRKLFRR